MVLLGPPLAPRSDGSDYQRRYEPILYGWPKGVDHFWCGDRDQGDVWFIKRPMANLEHPAMKPVDFVERALRNSSKSRNTVLDRLADPEQP